MFKRILQVTVWSALVGSFAFPALIPAVASADPPLTYTFRQQVANSGYAASVPLTAQQDGLGTPNRRVPIPAPIDCLLRIGDLHASVHRPGFMNGTVIGECPTPVDEMFHYAQIWERRFWGWDRIGVRDVYEGSPTRRGVATASDFCKVNPGGIQLEGYGRVTIAGTPYYVINKLFGQVKPNPCGL